MEMTSYMVCEAKGSVFDTLCHIARNPHDVLNVRSLCGVRLVWTLGDYETTPPGWNLCQKCQSIGKV